MSLPYSRNPVKEVELLHLLWRKCNFQIQEIEKWQYKHYICGEKSQPNSRSRINAIKTLCLVWCKSHHLIQEPNPGGINIIPGVQEMSLPNKETNHGL